MGDIELREFNRRSNLSRGRTRIPRPISESGVERRSSRYSRHLAGGSSSHSREGQPSNSIDLDRIEVESEINGSGHGAVSQRPERQVPRAKEKVDDQLFSKPVALVYAYNLGFLFCMVPFYVGAQDGSYTLRPYVAQMIPYALAVTITTLHLFAHFIFEYGQINMDLKPHLGYETATDFVYLLCVLGHIWMLVGVRKKLQSFVQKFSASDESGFFRMFSKLAPLALVLLAGCTYIKVGEWIRLGRTNALLDETYEKSKHIFHVAVCSRSPKRCETIVAQIILAIEIYLEIEKYILEVQMLASSAFIHTVANELGQHCSEFGDDMTNANIIKSTQLFSVARNLIGDLNKSNSSLSIFYFTQLFPFLVVSLFHIAMRDYDWLARNGLLLLIKLSVPFIASNGTRKFGKWYSQISNKLGYHHLDTEGLVDPIERTERRSYREGLINDFEKAAREPITLQCLGYYSVNEKWIVMLVGAVYGTCCFLLDLSLGIRRGATGGKEVTRIF